jgi:serine/threonine-protein kinase RsbW
MSAIADGGPASDDIALVSIAAGPMVTPVLGRIIGVFAARAELSLDRLNDAVLIGDAIADSGALHQTSHRVQVGITASPRRLDLRVGPLVDGGGERLLHAADIPGIGAILTRLADEVEVRPTDDGDFLHLALIDG